MKPRVSFYISKTQGKFMEHRETQGKHREFDLGKNVATLRLIAYRQRTETDRQRQIDRQTQRQGEQRNRDRQTEQRQTDRHRDRQTDTETDRQTENRVTDR